MTHMNQAIIDSLGNYNLVQFSVHDYKYFQKQFY